MPAARTLKERVGVEAFRVVCTQVQVLRGLQFAASDVAETISSGAIGFASVEVSAEEVVAVEQQMRVLLGRHYDRAVNSSMMVSLVTLLEKSGSDANDIENILAS